jgi:hypothetical protein
VSCDEEHELIQPPQAQTIIPLGQLDNSRVLIQISSVHGKSESAELGQSVSVGRGQVPLIGQIASEQSYREQNVDDDADSTTLRRYMRPAPHFIVRVYALSKHGENYETGGRESPGLGIGTVQLNAEAKHSQIGPEDWRGCGYVPAKKYQRRERTDNNAEAPGASQTRTGAKARGRGLKTRQTVADINVFRLRMGNPASGVFSVFWP